jgi:glycosyltransferase involved in cell wall biosynthesis
MRIVLALLYYDDVLALQGTEEYLRLRPLQRELGSAFARAGHEVEAVMLFPTDAVVRDGPMIIRFASPGLAARALGSAAHSLGRVRACYEPALAAIEAIIRKGADVVHFHGSTLHLNLALLASRLKDEALVVQYHGGGPARNRLTRTLQRAGLARADRLLFTSVAQAEPFVAAGVLDGTDRVRTALEVSTSMVAPDREEARKRSGLVGDPIFVSAGRLHPDKDPLTALRGFEIIARSWPGSRLYFCYLTDELLPSLTDYVVRRPELTERVRCLGRVPHGDMAAILGSADFLLQASLREVASYAVIEAIAAGVVPAITRIPTFEKIAGRHGVFFPPGDPDALAHGVLSVDPRTLPARRRELRAHFDACLSFTAVARGLEAIYGEAIGSRRQVRQRRS